MGGGYQVEDGLFQKSPRKLTKSELFAKIWPKMAQNVQKKGRGARWDRKRACFPSPPKKKDEGGRDYAK